MKTLITLLAIAFSANSFAHGTYLNPTERATLSPFFGTSFTEATVNGTTDATSAKKASRKVLQDVQEYHQSGLVSVALEESIKNLQSIRDISSDEAVDAIVDMAEGILAN